MGPAACSGFDAPAAICAVGGRRACSPRFLARRLHSRVPGRRKFLPPLSSGRPAAISPLLTSAPPPPRNTTVNYEDPNYNISLPVFIIHGARMTQPSKTLSHSILPPTNSTESGQRLCLCPLCECGATNAGNHDDPAGQEDLSALDMLAASNLLNYFGKTARDCNWESEIGIGN